MTRATDGERAADVSTYSKAPSRQRRKPKPKPDARRASDVIEEARLALTAAWPTTDANTQATLVLFALSRALRREDPAALGALASAARDALAKMAEHDGRPLPRADWTNAGHLLGADHLEHRRFVARAMSEMLVHHREAFERPDARRPPPLPATYMAQALSRLLGSGPLRDSYESRWTPEKDGDAERIIAAWAKYATGDGRIHVKPEPATLARKLVEDALVALGAPAQSVRRWFRAKELELTNGHASARRQTPGR